MKGKETIRDARRGARAARARRASVAVFVGSGRVHSAPSPLFSPPAFRRSVFDRTGARETNAAREIYRRGSLPRDPPAEPPPRRRVRARAPTCGSFSPRAVWAPCAARSRVRAATKDSRGGSAGCVRTVRLVPRRCRACARSVSFCRRWRARAHAVTAVHRVRVQRRDGVLDVPRRRRAELVRARRRPR